MESKKKEDQQAKLKESKLKKQEKIIVRNDHQDIEDDFEEVQTRKPIKISKGFIIASSTNNLMFGCFPRLKFMKTQQMTAILRKSVKPHL